MRNPIQKLYSDFSYLCEEYRKKNLPRGHLTNSTEVFHRNALGGMEALKECLEKVSLEKCVHQSLLGQTSGCGRVRLGISLYIPPSHTKVVEGSAKEAVSLPEN